MAKIDLHIHTNCSDGALSPKQVVDEALKNSVDTISICDHDSIDAYNTELFSYAEQKGIQLIYGVEMSTRFYGVGIHVLGYNFDLKNEKLLNTLSMLKNSRRDYASKVCNLLKSLGYIVNLNDLLNLPTVTKAHIALQIVENEKNKKILMQTFGYIPSKGDFIEKIMNEGCPAFVEKFSITPIEASLIIHKAGGKVVLAHPVAYAHEDGITEDQIESLIKQMKADGVETYYVYVDRNEKVFDEAEMWNKMAKKLNVFTTAGSDFHATDGIRPNIGFDGLLYFSDVQIEQMKKNILE